MQDTDLFQLALGLSSPWMVTRSGFDAVDGLGSGLRPRADEELAQTIMAKSEGILRSIATGLSNGVLEAINGNVQAARRKAKGYRTKRNLKAIVYLIAGDVLANSPI
jgi:Transposase